MSFETVVFITGAILLAIALLGIVIEFSVIKTGNRDNPLDKRTRLIIGILGVCFIGLSIWLNRQDGTASAQVDPTPTPPVEVASLTPIPPTEIVKPTSTEPSLTPQSNLTPEIATPTDAIQTPIPETLPIDSLSEFPLRTEEIGIIIHVDLSGSGRERGEEILRGLAFELKDRVSQLPTAIGSRIAIRYVDDGGDPTRARQVAHDVAQLPNVIAVLGLNRSVTALEAMKEYDPAKIPVISISATNSKLTDKNIYPNHVFIRMVTSDDAHAQFAVQFMQQLNAKNVRIFYVNDPYGDALSSAVESEIRKTSTINTGTRWPLPTNPSPQDITSAVGTIQSNDDLIYFAGYYNQAALLFPEIRAKFPNIQIIGSDGVDNDLLRAAGPSIITMYYTSIAAPQSLFNDLDALVQRYQSANPKADVPTYLGESYDAMGICLQSILNMYNNRGTISRANMYLEFTALTAVGKKVQGVAGPYHFSLDGDLENPVYYMRQYTGGPWNQNPIKAEGRR